jgi:penicillin-binding protein 2B
MTKNKRNKLINFFIGLVFLCFAFLFLKTLYISCFDNVEGTNLQDFANSRSIVSKDIISQRGTIYDANGEKLANNVFSYTLIAYLDPSRSENEDKLYHVKDIQTTAEKLATVINIDEEKLLDILNQKDLYQVEFGIAGKSLTEIEKDKIVELELPGIDFIANEKRYYSNGDFLSYTLGYAKKDNEDKIVGEYGMEKLLNDVLSGEDGHITYEKDINGYKIPGTTPVIIPAEDGNDVYLTIDSNIQFFLEQALNESAKNYDFEWLTLIAANAKTGEILGIAQNPSYDPNVLEIDDWINHSVKAYEPGSIMKTYTFMAAMENGVYDETETYKSGSFVTTDGTKIYDWNKTGFGTITFDQGYMASSNVGIINLIERHLSRDILHDYFEKLGFGEKTGITIDIEEAGSINFKYQTEILNAGFGQGIKTNPIQHIKALTSIANDGDLLKARTLLSKLENDKEFYTLCSNSTKELYQKLYHESNFKI